MGFKLCICFVLSTFFDVLSLNHSLPRQEREEIGGRGLTKQVESFPYDLGEIEKKYKLPKEAEEISALSYVSEDLLAFVQDEAGIVYYFDVVKEKIIRTTKFKKSGDFEGVEMVDGVVYALRSDGKIFEVMDSPDTESGMKTYETLLSEKNNTEGLGYDPEIHALLIACKGSASTKKGEYKGFRAVYAFELEQKKLIETPYLLIREKEIQKIMDDKNQEFMPAGIAIHPISGDRYLLSSVGQLMVVYSPAGEIKWVKKLDKGDYRHPEGICFSPRGDLYISNEGDGKKGNILKIAYQP